MLFMFRVSVEMMVLALVSWELWLGLALVALTAIIARRRAGRDTGIAAPANPRSAIHVLSIIVIPLVILAWGLYFWPEQGRGAHEQFAVRALDVFALCQLAVSIALVWRWQGRLGTVLGAAFAMWWAAGALSTANMAVTNTWL